MVVVCKDEEAARECFGVVDESIGIVYTRTGRRFFNDLDLEAQFLARVRDAISAAAYWRQFDTTWMLLDCELMPWSAKAQALLQEQYAAVGSAATASIGTTVELMQTAANNGSDIGHLLEKYSCRQTQVAQYIDAYRQYCWPVNSLDDLKLAPFHLLATEGATHIDKSHTWHMEALSKLVSDDLLMVTDHKIIDLTDEASQFAGIVWWEDLTNQGGEGLIVKPLDFITKGQHKGSARCVAARRQSVAVNTCASFMDRCADCMNVCLACSHWRVNRSIRGCSINYLKVTSCRRLR
ncbi:MAG: hypothetical protein KC708_21095 [Anaerolineae bacterium]|nr:hypothetical protein [Anaerolineae bacterium]